MRDIKRMESEKDPTMHPLHIHACTDYHALQTWQCSRKTNMPMCVYLCACKYLWCVATHGQFPELLKTELTSQMSSLLGGVQEAQNKVTFFTPTTHFQILACLVCVCCAHYRSTVPLAPDSTQQTQRTLTCTLAIASLISKCPQSCGQVCVNGYIYMHPYTVIKAMLQFSWRSKNTVIRLMWLCSVTITVIQYVDHWCFNCSIQACISYIIMHACMYNNISFMNCTVVHIAEFYVTAPFLQNLICWLIDYTLIVVTMSLPVV